MQQQQHQLCVSCHNQEVHIKEHLTATLKELVQKYSGTSMAIQSSDISIIINNMRNIITSDHKRREQTIDGINYSERMPAIALTKLHSDKQRMLLYSQTHLDKQNIIL